MKKLISIILTTTLTFSMLSCANCFADKSTAAQGKAINIKTSSLNETRNAVDKVYGSIPRKTSLFKKFLAITATLSSVSLVTFAAFKKNITNLWNSSVDNNDNLNVNQDDNPLVDPDTTDSSNTSDSNNSNSLWQKFCNWFPFALYLTSSSVCTYNTGDPLTCFTTGGLSGIFHFNPTLEGLKADILKDTTSEGISTTLSRYANFISSNNPNLIYNTLYDILPEISKESFSQTFFSIFSKTN